MLWGPRFTGPHASALDCKEEHFYVTSMQMHITIHIKGINTVIRKQTGYFTSVKRKHPHGLRMKRVVTYFLVASLYS